LGDVTLPFGHFSVLTLDDECIKSPLAISTLLDFSTFILPHEQLSKYIYKVYPHFVDIV
jgi:hypothetical protein